jgi:hypothetical protein
VLPLSTRFHKELSEKVEGSIVLDDGRAFVVVALDGYPDDGHVKARLQAARSRTHPRQEPFFRFLNHSGVASSPSVKVV